MHADPALAGEDFHSPPRRLFAYNPAVVIDDHFQGVTEIVRGADLIEPTVRQIAPIASCRRRCPPMASAAGAGANGIKLSKKTMRRRCPPAIRARCAIAALKFLRQPLPESWQDLDLPLLLSWGGRTLAVGKRRVREAILWMKTRPAFSKEPW